ncbi:MAG TPA: hypothetical protein VK403_08215 [Allosphingosinicella sp.]|nr:hypothetical protein [Allosphingosinicella sp.]
MSKTEIWLSALLWVAATLLLPVAASEPACPEEAERTLGACADGSAQLAMGCASILL